MKKRIKNNIKIFKYLKFPFIKKIFNKTINKKNFTTDILSPEITAAKNNKEINNVKMGTIQRRFQKMSIENSIK